MNNSHRYFNYSTLLYILLWALVLMFGYYFTWRLTQQEKFGFHDWYLFIGHAKTFLTSDLLYNRDLSLYAPAAAIYKFPPLFASILVLFLEFGCSEANIKLAATFAILFCYFCSIAILLWPQHTKKTLLIPVALIFALGFEPFFDNYDSAQMEIYILLMLSLSLVTLLKGKDLLSGIFIGVAAAIKIYPIYLAGYYLATKKYSALVGITLGLAVTTIFSMAIIGYADHEFYFFNILPTLLAEAISGRGENLSLGHLLVNSGWALQTVTWMNLVILFAPIVILFYLDSKQSKTLDNNSKSIWFAIFITLLLLASKNSWWNYQILLMLPLLVIVRSSLGGKKIGGLALLPLTIAWLLIFWCNLGKLETLIVFFTKMLDASPALTTVMLKINLLRGIGTFLILLTLVLLLAHQQRQNISLVENRPST